MARVTAKALYNKLQDTNVLHNAKAYSKWTNANLMADYDVGVGKLNPVERDFQSMGALLTNSLASKMAQILFPIQQPFFSLDISPELEELNRQAGKGPEELKSLVSNAVRDACKTLYKNESYANIITAIKHLVVTGNVLLYRDAESRKTLAYGLRQYVIRRGGNGAVLLCIHKEKTYVEALTWEDQQTLKAANPAKYGRPEQEITIYTKIQRKATPGRTFKWVVSYEVDEFELAEAQEYPDKLCPWCPIAINLNPGSHYGEGLVSEYAGDFARLSQVSEAAVLYGIEISRLINLVATGGMVDIEDINNAQTGDFIQGEKDSIHQLDGGDANKLQVLMAMEDGAFTRLSRAFMYQGPTRQAERVTMYELQLQVQEANNQFGGLYSTLAEGLQIPIAVLLLDESAPNLTPARTAGYLVPDITAGVNALGRAEEVQSLAFATQEATAIVPALMQLDKRIDPLRVLDMLYQARAVRINELMYDKATLAKLEEAESNQAQGINELSQAAAAGDALKTMQESM